MLTFNQTAEENRAEFITRLMATGWTKAEAQQEWRDAQDDCESEP